MVNTGGKEEISGEERVLGKGEMTYFEEIVKNDIRLVLCKLHNALGEAFVHEDRLPASDS
jgi:hypothetical protein